MDPQFKFAGGILCLITLMSSLTSGAGGALRLRDGDLDFSKMPECSSKICAPILGSLLDCGQRIMVDCFCRRPNPLICAWTVNWDCWNRTEDWYDTQCPGKPLVDLTAIPGCARSCFDNANVCLEMTSNCVCSQPRPDCNSITTTCNSTEVSFYDAWYAKSCKYNLTAMTTSVSSPSTTASSTSSTSASTRGGGGGGGLSKGAIAGVTIGAVTGALALGVFLCFFRKRKDPGPACDAAKSQGVHEMEGSSDPKLRPGLILSVVQSAPIVEAPGDYR
ncbi:hypothetical protein HOY82DRAFT_358011 [Tuber indicum]|nr:hypothetical protein HOY82DRAFT_358011 [Tuber indicum]